MVWSLRHLADELKTIGTLLALDHIWRQIDSPPPSRRRPGSSPQVRRLVVVDEAWMMLRDGAAATWMFKMAKAARKRNAGLAVITQDAADVLGTQLGQAVVANAATQVAGQARWWWLPFNRLGTCKAMDTTPATPGSFRNVSRKRVLE